MNPFRTMVTVFSVSLIIFCGAAQTTEPASAANEESAPSQNAEPDPLAHYPNADVDQDGVPNAEDQCPCHAEDMDGFNDDDGCPDPDNDEDRVPDVCDHCPNDPEPINGWRDEDGCRDPERRIGDGQVRIGTLILFGRNSATISPQQSSVLDQLAATLLAHREIRVLEVQGHASEGERRATRLSERRAQNVIDALVERGVGIVHAAGQRSEANRAQLRSRSFGATRLREPGDHEFNRRVEFSILEIDEDVHTPPPPFEPPCEAPVVESACDFEDEVSRPSEGRE